MPTPTILSIAAAECGTRIGQPVTMGRLDSSGKMTPREGTLLVLNDPRQFYPRYHDESSSR